jgi:hypothetical protein
MTDQEVLDCFMEGFAKRAEDAGLQGEQVLSLLKLSVDLAQRTTHGPEFDAGFASVMGGAPHGALTDRE